MQSRLLPAPAARPAQPWPRRLCYPDLRARRLQARRGSGPGDGPARQVTTATGPTTARCGSGHSRCTAATGRGGGGRQRPRRAACDSDSLPPKQEDAPSPGPARRSSNPAKAPAATG